MSRHWSSLPQPLATLTARGVPYCTLYVHAACLLFVGRLIPTVADAADVTIVGASATAAIIAKLLAVSRMPAPLVRGCFFVCHEHAPSTRLHIGDAAGEGARVSPSCCQTPGWRSMRTFACQPPRFAAVDGRWKTGRDPDLLFWHGRSWRAI